MATGNSSSRKKSSSSHNKKHSKNSSEVRKRRRKSRSRTKTKSKKLQRRDVSLSSYSDRDSMSENSISVSSSDSEDGYQRGRMARVEDVKRSRKRVRRISSSHGGNGESPHLIKRKESKRNGDYESKKKTQKRKRVNVDSRREGNGRSKSSDSRSCSTCWSGNSSDGENGFEQSKSRGGRSEKRGRDKRSLGNMGNGKKKSGYRSRSVSSCSGCSESSGYQSEERWLSGSNQKRLKSVLTVTNQSKDEEERDRSKDENKEEIIQDYDDYPSCRSNDSYEGGRKRGSAQHPHGSEKKRGVDDAKKEEAFTSKESDQEKDVGVRHGGTDPASGAIGSTNSMIECKSEIPSSIGNLEDDALESFLRQKALENLKKLRGVIHSNRTFPGNQKDESGTGTKQPSAAKVEFVQTESHKENASRVVCATQQAARDVKSVSIPTTIKSKLYSSSQNAVYLNEHGNKLPSTAKVESIQIDSHKEDGDRVAFATKEAARNVKTVTISAIGRKPTSSAQNVRTYDGHGSRSKPAARPVLDANNLALDRTAVSSNPTEKNYTMIGTINKTSRVEFSGDHTNLKQAPTAPEAHKGNLLNPKNIADKDGTETPQATPESSRIHDVEVNKACGLMTSFPNHPSGEDGSDEQQGEVNEDSQYKQKTMSVMRGGEMVQVSYKVYIPKKTPALARRQLKR